jgi:hypothetical protein
LSDGGTSQEFEIEVVRVFVDFYFVFCIELQKYENTENPWQTVATFCQTVATFCQTVANFCQTVANFCSDVRVFVDFYFVFCIELQKYKSTKTQKTP